MDMKSLYKGFIGLFSKKGERFFIADSPKEFPGIGVGSLACHYCKSFNGGDDFCSNPKSEYYNSKTSLKKLLDGCGEIEYNGQEVQGFEGMAKSSFLISKCLTQTIKDSSKIDLNSLKTSEELEKGFKRVTQGSRSRIQFTESS